MLAFTSIFIGLPGAGKSSTSKQLAETLGTQVIETDSLFRKYRGVPSTNQDGTPNSDPDAQIILQFLNETKDLYPNYYSDILNYSSQIVDTYPDGSPRSKLYDSKLFRSIGHEEHGEDIFRLFEIVMNEHMFRNGMFKNKIPDLSASALLYERNIKLFSKSNGYRIILLDIDDDVLNKRLYQDFIDFVKTKKLKRGGYIQYVIKRLKDIDKLPIEQAQNLSLETAENFTDKICNYLREKSMIDKNQRLERYCQIADYIIDVSNISKKEVIIFLQEYCQDSLSA